MTDNDPIEATPGGKRRKLNNGRGVAGQGWDSAEDDGDEFFENYEHNTMATLPLTKPGQAPPSQLLKYSNEQFQSNYANSFNNGTLKGTSQTLPRDTQPVSSYTTQPTQPVRAPSEVQVDASSPVATPDHSMPPPSPIRKAPFAKPRSSFLQNTLMAPRGTTVRRPPTAPQAPASDDSEEDPPVERDSDDDQTKGPRSNIKPTKFVSNGKELVSSPPRRIQESPRQAPAPPPHQSSNTGSNFFSSFLSEYKHTQSPQTKQSRPAGDDMASAYGSSSRAPRPQQPSQQAAPSRAQALTASPYKTLDDIADFNTRQKARHIMNILPTESLPRIMDALKRKRQNQTDAMNWLVESAEDRDELAISPPAKPSGPKGVARAVSSSQSGLSSQPIRGPVSTRQEVKKPVKSIAQKYGTAQVGRKPSQVKEQEQKQEQEEKEEDEEEDDVRPRKGRLIQRPKRRSPTPPSSPPATAPVVQQSRNSKTTITIDDDSEDEDEGIVADHEEVDAEQISRDKRLLDFFNQASVQDIADLSAQPEDDVKYLLDQKPFDSLAEIREVSRAPPTKSGKKSRARPVGDKILDLCSEMMTGYDAVDELVRNCEALAEPIRSALKAWGVGEGNGELQLMNLDEAHDSGIGTPSSSCAPDGSPNSGSGLKSLKGKPRGKFLAQPVNMSTDITLKDYQLVGLNWLNLLWSKKLSCILADDMGLGKTCQVISFLSYLQTQEVDGVHLVIVPGSTLENWLREFKNFSPGLNVVPYYGSQAERPGLQQEIEDHFSEIDVIVTTYDMTTKPDDNKFLRRLEPSVCVYDEAHALRNPKSDRYRQLMRIPADFKILLTGTPLQNNLQELVAILAFIMPNMFTEKAEQLEYIFQHKATTKDADHAALLSAERITRARSMMTPFILRRKKAQVLWLPTKHSRVEHCEMTASQEDMYHEVLSEAQEVFAQKAGGKKVNAKASSNVLMALRKAAIHPLLSRRIYTDKRLEKIQKALLNHDEFGGNPPEKVWDYLVGKSAVSIKGGDYGFHRFCMERDYLHRFALKREEWMDCGKVQKFKELVQAYAANGDRALVFSQFTTLMDILEGVLTTLGIRYMRLDGSTRMDTRQDMIDEFYGDEDLKVFMLSTKAGGAGINLACANKVIIFDSGFNPQDDVQAENRAHRVGQTREVEVIRLVTRGTIEEQIHALGESKLALDERVAGEGATAADEKQAEKAGEKAVEQMFLKSLEKEEGGKEDMKDTFKKGLEKAGLKVD